MLIIWRTVVGEFHACHDVFDVAFTERALMGIVRFVAVVTRGVGYNEGRLAFSERRKISGIDPCPNHKRGIRLQLTGLQILSDIRHGTLIFRGVRCNEL